MYPVVKRENLVPNIHLFEIEAPAVARKVQAGQFVIVRVDDKGERIPLTVAGWDRERGTVTIVALVVGTTTRKLAALKVGDSLATFVGPLGLPMPIDRYGTVVCCAGCYGIATTVPVAAALKEAGNRVISIMEARTGKVLFWQDRLAKVSDELIVTTEDGSCGQKGWVYDPLKVMLERGDKIDRVIAMGCTFMMKLCSDVTRLYKVKTIVSLNPIMVDGTGMCGACRVSVGGVTRFACVDGPDFDGHEVDWDLALARRYPYLDEEVRSLEHWEAFLVCP